MSSVKDSFTSTETQPVLVPVETKPLRIGINLLFLIHGEMGGAETLAISLLEAMLRMDVYNSYVLFINKSGEQLRLPTGPNIKLLLAPVSGRSRALRYAWEQIGLPLQAKRERIDILHSLHYVGPVITFCKTVLTIPDTNHRAVANTMSLIKRIALGSVSRMAARTSDKIVAISNFSKKEICEGLHVEPKKVEVIHLGCGWSPLTPLTEALVRHKYNLIRPYLAVFGGGYPHKNIPRLVEAFATLSGRFNVDLVVLGRLASDVHLSAIAHDDVIKRIRLLGYVPAEDIEPLLSGATLFVFPSLYEGFGLPLVEAQRAGTPVVCSNAAAIPEVVGDGAHFFDPTNVSSIMSSIVELLESPEKRQELSRLGRENHKRFSWEGAALQHLALYRAVGAKC